MQLSCFLYIKRRWDEDRCKIKNLVEYISSLKRNYQILIFPEGTDLTPKTLEKSHQYANKYNLKVIIFYAYPARRTKFSCVMPNKGCTEINPRSNFDSKHSFFY